MSTARSSIPKLEELTGQAVSWHGCGGLRLATTDEEVDWLQICLRHIAPRRL